MKYKAIIILFTILMVSVSSFAASVATPPGDAGWPRLILKNGKQLTIYQPQVDFWKDYANIHFRCAISVKTGASQKEKFGVVEVDADTVTNHDTRVVVLIPTKRELRFPNTSETETASLQRVVEELHPFGQAMTVSMDRVLAYLDPAKHPLQQAVELNLDPPKIFYSSKPAILVMFLGEPQLQPVEADNTDLMFATNTNWDVFYDTAGQLYYLLNHDNWLTTANAINGTWMPAGALPAGLSSLPPDDNWADVRLQVPGKREKNPPVVFVSTEPAELILTNGEPSYSPIPGTKLLRIANTETTVFLNSGDKKFYLLTAGRWFRAAKLDGSWSSASKDLPADFARIPDSDPAAFVKASVPGTNEARDAVLLASVPKTTVVNVSSPPPPVQVTYSGQPQFQAIPDTTVQYAVNSPNAVFVVNGGYYCCDQGVWFSSGTANGPWTYCTSVPPAIYTIPASHPAHNVTYVVVQNTSPTLVTYTQTAGYSGEYVAATGVVMFGAGVITGALIANNNHYYPGYPAPYSYGCGARYSYASGGYYRSSQVSYGPYGGAGSGAAYNSNTGTYSRGAYAYGPAGSASARQAYNPYTGARAAGTQVNTAYGSAGRAAAYNPATGTAASGGYRTSDYGSAAAVQTNKDTGAAVWNTQSGQGAVVKTKSGNVYAGKDGNVYKKDSSGNWSSNTGSGWETANMPQPRNASTMPSPATSTGGSEQSYTPQSQHGATQETRQASTTSENSENSLLRESSQSLNSQAQARERGNQLSQITSSERSSDASFFSRERPSSSPFGGSRMGGGGGRRGR